MIFGDTALDQADGAVLAHTQRLPDRVLHKGAVLDAALIAVLRAAGRSSVIAARLEPGDVGEDAAAHRLAEALLVRGLGHTRAATGRVNLVAEQSGLLRVHADRIDALNGVHESLTVATLPDYATVAPRDMVATIKVIPFAVPGTLLQRVEETARDAPAFSLHPFRAMTVGLILTQLPGLKESAAEKTIAATRGRVAGLGGTLLPPLRCPHTTEDVRVTLGRLLAQGAELLLISGASAVLDRRDVGPAGIVAAGGAIAHFGMPVDPGNLICVGMIGAVPTLVLPGCASSPKANGIDWVLARLFAGLPVGAAEIMRMGVGGLLNDTGARPLPRAKASPMQVPAPIAPAIEDAHTVAAVVLAAGRSSRMAPHNKLLLPDRTGKPMVARVVDNLLSSSARPIVVVLGHRAAEVQAALGRRPVQYVIAPDYADGLSASLRTGIAAVPSTSAAALVCLGDMPLVTGRMMDRLLDAYDPDEGRTIVAPTHGGRIGNPILWDRRYFAEIRALTGDAGARILLQRHAEQVAEIELGEDAILRDFDTVESLAGLPERLRPALDPAE